MKKLIKSTLIALLSLSVTPLLTISAQEISTEDVAEQYLKEKNVTSTSELSREEEMELFEKIDKIKKKATNSSSSASPFRRSTRFPYPMNHNFFGDIFITMDNTTKGFRHGHAGIGANMGGAVIEANPEDNVKLHYNRVRYWLDEYETGGIMRVKNAETHHYKTAAAYAKRMADEKKRYGFNALDVNDFYCSELVYYAWQSAGFNIASKRSTPLILPIDIILDDETFYIAFWK